MMTLLDRNMLQ